ncbi:ExbD/TolR family protein [Anianabacter salinae]|uniref:ExbD/TolR family protein n=1 Tax=Anianabacter salinae TaxID=2851023 RepID=UPI00225E5847|nr:biopolymer transporter ExbD [Anianabacter salinae]MBV0912472.1 biopolymer transporter ExbD [Anianabacter salinae]
MRRARPRSDREPTIALINIVFLMLIFFLVAGTLAPPLDGALRLVNTAEWDAAPPPDALVLHADGSLAYRGAPIASAAAFAASLPEEDRDTLRIVPDRAAPAQRLVAVGAQLRAAGAGRIVIVTERALP